MTWPLMNKGRGVYPSQIGVCSSVAEYKLSLVIHSTSRINRHFKRTPTLPMPLKCDSGNYIVVWAWQRTNTNPQVNVNREQLWGTASKDKSIIKGLGETLLISFLDIQIDKSKAPRSSARKKSHSDLTLNFCCFFLFWEYFVCVCMSVCVCVFI